MPSVDTGSRNFFTLENNNIFKIKLGRALDRLGFLKSKLNYFSVIGSVLYGLFCASNPTPEVVAVIGYVLYFLLAATFYFAMYVVYSQSKQLSWLHILKSACKLIVGIFGLITTASVLYMLFNQVSYDCATSVIASYIGNFFYYLPFLP